MSQKVEVIMVVLAGVLYAFALKYFVLPAKVILTGTEGIATSVAYFFDNFTLFIILYAIFQLILLIFAFRYVSRIFAVRTLIVVSTVVILLAVLPDFQFAQPEPQNERILLVLFGGILAGAAKALAFNHRGSTGDEDILGAYIASKYLRPVGDIAIYAAVFSTTIGLTLDLIKNQALEPVVNTLMYTCIYIFASAETLNNMYPKFKITMLVIMTKAKDEVATAILSAAGHRTYSLHDGQGGKSGDRFFVFRTVITHEELPQMLESVQRADSQCFYYYHDIDGISNRYYIQPIK